MKMNKKITWFVGMIGGVLMALSFLGCGTVHTEIVIPASSLAVWSVLTDVAGYDDWNPVLIPIEGDIRQGEKLKYRMIQPDGKESEVKAKVIEITKERTLNQFGGIWGILTFNHKWLLIPVDGGTRVTQHEEYRGIGVLFWDYSWVELAYSKANEALKKRVMRIVEERK
jgi:hypothetical protein